MTTIMKILLKRCSLLRLFAMLCMVGLFTGSPCAVQAQSAASVIGKHLQATGGADAWRRIRTVEIKGVIQRGGGAYAQVFPQISFRQRILHRIGVVQENENKGSVLTRLISPAGVWETANDHPPFRVSDGPPAHSSLYDLQGELVDYVQKGHRFTLKKTAMKVGKIACYVIKGTLSDETKVVYYISKADYLLLQTKEYPNKQARRTKGIQSINHSYSDFRNIQGYTVPFIQQDTFTANGSSQVIKQEVITTALKFNDNTITPALFTPAGITKK